MMQSYGTAPSRNTMHAASAPKKRGLIEGEMMAQKEMKMATPKGAKKGAKRVAKKAAKGKK